MSCRFVRLVVGNWWCFLEIGVPGKVWEKLLKCTEDAFPD